MLRRYFEKVFKEMIRILKPEGKLFLIVDLREESQVDKYHKICLNEEFFQKISKKSTVKILEKKLEDSTRMKGLKSWIGIFEKCGGRDPRDAHIRELQASLEEKSAQGPRQDHYLCLPRPARGAGAMRPGDGIEQGANPIHRRYGKGYRRLPGDDMKWTQG